jgi:hypothetical protein
LAAEIDRFHVNCDPNLHEIKIYICTIAQANSVAEPRTRAQ